LLPARLIPFEFSESDSVNPETEDNPREDEALLPDLFRAHYIPFLTQCKQKGNDNLWKLASGLHLTLTQKGKITILPSPFLIPTLHAALNRENCRN
jgi:hypothetical protein